MSAKSGITNPKTFTITDSTLVADQVTGMNIKFSTTAGGPYSLVAPVPAADITAEVGGLVSGTFESLNEKLAPGTWYGVATAVNATGESGPSPEFDFDIVAPLPLPSAPTSFSVA